MRRLPVPQLLAASLLALSSCLPLEPAGKSAALEARVAALEKQLAETRHQQDTSLTLLPPRLTDLEQAVEEAQKSRSKEQAETVARNQEFQAQLQWLLRLYNILDDAVISGERALGLSVTQQDLVPTLTRYGTFLFKLTGYDKKDGGYDLHLSITNVTPVRIHRFRLHGDFGPKSPVLEAKTSTRQRMETLDAWELSLVKYEQAYDTVLEPNERSSLVLHVAAKRLAELEFIRLWIDVQAVSLPASRPAGSSTATFDASRPDSSILHVLPSDAGTFYLKLEKIVPGTGNGSQQLHLRFGNPLGMTIDKIRFHGTLGKKPPQAGPNDPPEKRELDQLQWRQTRHAFSREIRSTLKPMQWNEITLELPAATAADLEHVECRVDVLELHLLPGK